MTHIYVIFLNQTYIMCASDYCVVDQDLHRHRKLTDVHMYYDLSAITVSRWHGESPVHIRSQCLAYMAWILLYGKVKSMRYSPFLFH